MVLDADQFEPDAKGTVIVSRPRNGSDMAPGTVVRTGNGENIREMNHSIFCATWEQDGADRGWDANTILMNLTNLNPNMLSRI
jgi:hypothetical protein